MKHLRMPTQFTILSVALLWMLALTAHQAFGQTRDNGFFLGKNGVTITCDAAAVGESGTIVGTTYTKIDSKDSLQVFGGGVPADQACTSGITNMELWFYPAFPGDSNNVIKHAYNPDISHWDVSDVTNMDLTFNDLQGFNPNLSSWDVSNVTRFTGTFQAARAFNSDISSWDVSSGEIFAYMFNQAGSFNQDIGDWDVSGLDTSTTYANIRGMQVMFQATEAFNQDLSGWCVLNIDAVDYNAFDWFSSLQSDYLPQWGQCPPNNPAFQLADNGVTVTCKDVDPGTQGTVAQVTYTKIDDKSKLDLGSGGVKADQACTSDVTSLREWFYNPDWIVNPSTFNDDISHWDVSEVTSMFRTFDFARVFNQDISNWDVSKVTDMSGMFREADAFDQPIGSWTTTKVTSIADIFASADSFNQDLSGWDVSNVTDMYCAFCETPFNQDIGNWDVSSVTDMGWMFVDSPFNQDIGNWDVSSVTDMRWMFRGNSSFNQDISGWDVSGADNLQAMFWGADAFNQDIGDWDVSNVAIADLLFLDADNFDQDLTEWCVNQLASEPTGFDDFSGLSASNLPQWGKCPVRKLTPSAPADGATTSTITPTMSWSADDRAESYTVQVSTDDFASTVVEQSSSTASLTTSALAYETTYSWRVRGSNTTGTGHTGPWSDTLSFTTRTAPTVDPPGTPTLTSPTDGATDVLQPLTLDWEAAARAASYTVQVSADGFESTALDQTTASTSVTTSALAFETTFSWRVKATNDAGDGQWSSVQTFTTGTPPAPGQVTLSSPADGATEVAYNPTMSWQAQAYATSYQVQATTDGFATPALDQTTESTSLQPNLEYNASYSWRVRAINSTGEGAWSEPWGFQTETVPAPGATTLSYPADEATGIAPDTTLRWAATTYASSYIVEIRDAADVSSLDTVSTNALAIDLAYASVYSWRVKARNNAGEGQWSDLWSFTTAAQPVGKLTALAPSDGATNVATSPALRWGRDANATSYEVHVSATNFATLLDEATVTDTSYAPTGLATQTSYQWRVRGRNLDGAGPWSDTLSFTTVPPSVSTPSMLSPAQNASDVPIPTVFAWEANDNATSYDIELFTDALVTTVFSLDVTDTTYTYADMQEQKDYLFRVRAKNAAGTSNWSNVEFKTGEKGVGTSTEWGVGDGEGDGAGAIPTSYGLEQNYPNPFNPSTVIRYAMLQAGEVQLEVYDMMGRKVSTLVRGTKSAGYHEAVFDASHLGSGAYMYRLMAGDVVLARTLYLIK